MRVSRRPIRTLASPASTILMANSDGCRYDIDVPPSWQKEIIVGINPTIRRRLPYFLESWTPIRPIPATPSCIGIRHTLRSCKLLLIVASFDGATGPFGLLSDRHARVIART